ncbi:hypothetical protein ACLG6S_14310 [Thermodesulfobacteriota bacterium B35]
MDAGVAKRLVGQVDQVLNADHDGVTGIELEHAGGVEDHDVDDPLPGSGGAGSRRQRGGRASAISGSRRQGGRGKDDVIIQGGGHVRVQGLGDHGSVGRPKDDHPALPDDPGEEAVPAHGQQAGAPVLTPADPGGGPVAMVLPCHRPEEHLLAGDRKEEPV